MARGGTEPGRARARVYHYSLEYTVGFGMCGARKIVQEPRGAQRTVGSGGGPSDFLNPFREWFLFAKLLATEFSVSSRCCLGDFLFCCCCCFVGETTTDSNYFELESVTDLFRCLRMVR